MHAPGTPIVEGDDSTRGIHTTGGAAWAACVSSLVKGVPRPVPFACLLDEQAAEPQPAKSCPCGNAPCRRARAVASTSGQERGNHAFRTAARSSG